MKDIAAFKTTDIDVFLEGVAAMTKQEEAAAQPQPEDA
jgi:hypothetical protein